tara:strand:- start:953 stop:1675 length:723 start_codon:yes stop_codon:yes gene_type:complete
MHIIVTGSHGFIGTHLCKHLELQGHTIEAWDTKLGKDINDFPDKPKGDLCIHLAALADIKKSFKDPDVFWQQNVVLAKKVFDACANENIKVIYASSSACLGWWMHPYAISKYVNELVAPTDSVGIRFSTVWGDGANPVTLVEKIKNKNLQYVTTHTRDLIHVSDVVTAIQTIIDNDIQGIVDCGLGIAIKISDLVAYNNIDVPVVEGENYELDSNTLSSTTLRQHGWSPKVNVMDEKLCN